jgi:hypothetical protein
MDFPTSQSIRCQVAALILYHEDMKASLSESSFQMPKYWRFLHKQAAFKVHQSTLFQMSAQTSFWCKICLVWSCYCRSWVMAMRDLIIILNETGSDTNIRLIIHGTNSPILRWIGGHMPSSFWWGLPIWSLAFLSKSLFCGYTLFCNGLRVASARLEFNQTIQICRTKAFEHTFRVTDCQGCSIFGCFNSPHLAQWRLEANSCGPEYPLKMAWIWVKGVSTSRVQQSSRICTPEINNLAANSTSLFNLSFLVASWWELNPVSKAIMGV